jgi:hypothetical protein
MLVVHGLGWFLFASYAISKTPMSVAVRSADKEALVLVLLTAVLGVCAVLAIPLLGHVITGHDLSTLAVIGWLVYILSAAASAPYSLLGAVRGMQAAVLLVHVAGLLLSLLLVASVAYTVRSIEWVPFALAIGQFATPVAIRLYISQPKRSSNQQSSAEVTPR